MGFSETKDNQIKRNVTLKRWEIAHISEEEYWEEYTTESLSKRSSERYKKKAKILIEEWKKYIKINSKTKVLQIGCGPDDVINHFPVVKKYSIDPLADFYKKKFKFNYKSTNLQKAGGENIPFKDSFFDVIVLTNVLDHTHMPEKVLSEIQRVLKKEGLFHFENYIFQRNFLRIAKIWGILKRIFGNEIYNVHHPYMFSLQDLKSLISEKFSIIKEEVGRDIGNYENFQEFEENIKKERKITIKIPARFGLYGSINYSCFCKKNHI
ncbi:methyltransferase domain-containing protein [Candidatus Pacearchaeota archaeon]|nr:methyltransferase domain-containing protein [Candidatus Pacearchaeota archaeon]